MNTAERTYRISKVLVVSELRASRSVNGKPTIWDRPAFVLGANAAGLAICWFVTFEILSLLPTSLGSLVETTTHQVLGFLPMFVFAIVLLAGVVFELGTSSRFGASDLVNFLPISKSEYVAASAISVGFVYAIYLSAAAGITLALAIQGQLLSAWLVSCALSTAALLTGGFVIEILRASVNRVYSAMSRRAGRGALVIRLALVMVVLVAVQVVVNPYVLLSLMNAFVGALDASFFVPPVWPSLTVFAVIAGDFTRSVVFGLLSVAFGATMFLIAVLVRSRYWNPTQAGASVSSEDYAPRNSRLGRLGFSNAVASIILKDLRGYTRQKELLSMLALPFIMAAALAIQFLTLTWADSDVPWLVAIFTGIASILVSASSLGNEGRSFMNMYIVPIDPKNLVQAKAASSLVISLGGAMAMSVTATILVGPGLGFFPEVLLMGALTSIESVFIGLCFATRYSDFAARPRPKFISTSGMLMAFVVGMPAVVLTSASLLLFIQTRPVFSILALLAAFSCISVLAYRYSVKGAETLMLEMRS